MTPLALTEPANAAVLGPIETSMEIDGNRTADAADAIDWDDFLSLQVVDPGDPEQPYTVAFTPTAPYTPTTGGASSGVIDGTFAYDEEESAEPDATLLEIAQAACGAGDEMGFGGGGEARRRSLAA